MVGTSQISAEDIVDRLAAWVESGSASVLVNSVRLDIEPLCNTILDRPEAPDCSFSRATTKIASPTVSTEPVTTDTVSTTIATTVATIVEASVEQAVGLRPGDIGGLIIGILIALLLLVFIALLLVLLFKKYYRNDFR